MIILTIIVATLFTIYLLLKKKKAKKPTTIEKLIELAKKGEQMAQAELLSYYQDNDFDEFMYWMWVCVYNGYNEEAVKAIINLIDILLPESNNGNLDAKEKLASIYRSESRAYEDRTSIPQQFPYDNNEYKELTEQLHLQLKENLNEL